jgi:hypothetical protein
MSNSYKVALVIIVIIAFTGAAFVLLGMRQETAVHPETFEEFDELYIYIDERGNANCQYVAQLLPSELANTLKYVVNAIGADQIKQSYIESIRGSYVEYGLEVKDPSCEVSGFGANDNFKLIINWSIPNMARRVENHWTITFEWVDNQSVAQDAVASQNYNWATIRGISEGSQYKIYSKTYVILPPSAENINCPDIGKSWFTDFGGGSCNETSLSAGQIGGRFAIIQDDNQIISTENEITITPEQILENYSAYTVGYDGAFPTENATFADSIKVIRLDLKYKQELDEQYPVFIGSSKYSLSPAQLLYYSADAITVIDNGGQFSIQQLISVAAPDNENGDWNASWRKFSKSEYVGLAENVRNEIASTHKAPSAIDTPLGKIRFRDALFTFTRILVAHDENGTLPNEIMFAPAPAGKLTWDNIEMLANYAYFLLPDTYVITNSNRANGVVSQVYQPGYDNENLARKLCEWANTNITYTSIPSPPTSDWVLENREGQCRDYANAYLALLRTAGIPAKRVSGWIIYTGGWRPPTGWEFIIGTTTTGETIASHAWTQVYIPNKGWIPVDPTAGTFEVLPYTVYKNLPQTWMGALAGYETAYELI